MFHDVKLLNSTQLNNFNNKNAKINEKSKSIDKSDKSDKFEIDDNQLDVEDMENRILNDKNIPLTEEFINGIFKRFNFDHKVINLSNFQTAMIHESYIRESLSNPKTAKLVKDIPPIDNRLKHKCMPLQIDSYQRLEFLGDGIIRHSIGKYLFLRYSGEREGFLTTNRSKLEDKYALSKLAKKLGFQKYAVISRQIERANGRTSFVDLTEDIFEAFIGALNLEIDENQTMKFIWAVIETEGDIAETVRTQKNYKDQLMRYFHTVDSVKHDLQYINEELETDNGRRRYKTIVIDSYNQRKLGIGFGRSKPLSQQRAAKDALIKENIIKPDVETEEFYDINDIDNVENEMKKVKNHMKHQYINHNINDDEYYDINDTDIINSSNLHNQLNKTFVSNTNTNTKTKTNLNTKTKIKK